MSAEDVTRSTPGWQKEAWEWIKALLIAFALVAIMRWLLFTPTIVSGQSMEPNFHDGQRLIVNKIIYDLKDISRGEVIVFHAPEGKEYIKRVIALPGETVKVDGDKVWIDGKEMDEPYLAEAIRQAQAEGRLYNATEDFSETVVPDDSLFVMGDNRPVSKDSRYASVGFIPLDEVVGRADLVFWPITQFRLVDHPEAGELVK